jgi:hypothetical protein
MRASRDSAEARAAAAEERMTAAMLEAKGLEVSLAEVRRGGSPCMASNQSTSTTNQAINRFAHVLAASMCIA